MSPIPVPKPQPSPKRPRKPLRARGGSAFPKQRDAEYRRWVRQENPCRLAGRFVSAAISPRDLRITEGGLPVGFRHVCWGPREAAHVGQHVATGAPDFGAVVTLCRAAHRFYDEHRSDWLAVTGFSAADMESAAGGLALRYVERGGQPVSSPQHENTP